MTENSTQQAKGSVIDYLGYLMLRLIVCCLQSTSLANCDYGCRALAYILSDVISLRKKVIDGNLELVYGRLDEVSKRLLRRRMWHHLLLMVCEIAHAPRKIHRTNWRDSFYMPNKNEFVKFMMDERATVLVTGHFGNFEVSGHTCALLGLPTSTIARPLDNPFVDQYVNEFRSETGQRILPKEGSSGAVQEVLQAGAALALLADQHAGAKGCWVDFFGHPTSCHKALALFVLSSEAPMLVNYCRRLDRPLRFEIGVTGIADPRLSARPDPPRYLDSVEELTTWYNQRLEDAIRMAPEQYWWLHRRWREVPEKVRKRLEKKRESRQAG